MLLQHVKCVIHNIFQALKNQFLYNSTRATLGSVCTVIHMLLRAQFVQFYTCYFGHSLYSPTRYFGHSFKVMKFTEVN